MSKIIIVNGSSKNPRCNNMRSLRTLTIFFICVIAFTNTYPTVIGDPEREISLYTPYNYIKISASQDLVFTLEISNNGGITELLDLQVLGPKGWETTFIREGYIVKSLNIKNNNSLTVTLNIIPLPGEGAGIYNFTIITESRDNVVRDELEINVELMEAIVSKGILVDTPYPSVEGPSDEEYEFRLNVKNMGSESTIIDFLTYHPDQWLVSIRPRYEDRLIRSLDFAPGQTQTVMLTIKPPLGVIPGEYVITVTSSSGDIQEDTSFTLNIIGLYEMFFSPKNDLLSIGAIQGNEAVVTFVHNNTGTATLEDVLFFSDKPDGWDVVLDPDEIIKSDPGSTREIRVVITPPSDAIPGDYVVKLYSAVSKRQLSEIVTLRVTVKGAVGWGYVGLGIILILLAAIGLIFRRFGRR
jgi:uncharacterized membrane protein